MLIITNSFDPTTNYAQLEPLDSLTRELASGLTFSQETLSLSDKGFTNLYWMEFNKEKFGFELVSSDLPIPLKNYDVSGKKVMAGINFGSFFLSDDLLAPKVTYYNLLIRNGEVFQFPSNNRPALKTSNGKLSHLHIQAVGTLKLGGNIFSWSGPHSHKNTDLIAFGMFDLTIVKSSASNSMRRKVELISNLNNQLVYSQGGRPKPLLDDYLKSWSVVLETDNKIIFFINDARPKIKGGGGVSVFELQEFLKRKFDYVWACVGDSGQSSKLMIKGDTTVICGNMHYQNYRNDPPSWDGENGRPIPVALLAYE